MALIDTFTVQEMNIDTKDLSYDKKAKGLEAYWKNEWKQHPTYKNCRFFYN